MLWHGSSDDGHLGVKEGAAARNAIPDSGSRLGITNSQAGVPISVDTIDEPDVPTTKPATGRVTGKAVDIQGHGPVADFTVNLFRAERIRISNAAEITVMFQDDSGSFEITDLEHTQMDLFARADGYQPVVIRSIEVTENTEVVELRFEEAATISGHVLSASSGHSIPGASVTVRTMHQIVDRPIPFALPGQSTKTLEDGSFSLRESSRESVKLQVSMNGYQLRTVGIGALDDGDIEVLLKPAGSISGRFIGVDGDDLQSTGVRLLHVKSGTSYTRRSDDEGRFTVTNLSPGEYELNGRSSAGPSRQFKFTLGDGEQLGGLQLLIMPGNEVVGRVSGLMTGESVLGVSAKVSRGDRVYSEVDTAGDYRLRGLPTGTVELVAATTKGRLLSTSVELQATTVAYADFIFDGTATIYGTITRGGEPLKNTLIELIPVDVGHPKGSASTSADGYYVFEGMASSRYVLRVNFKERRTIELNGATQFDVDL